MKSVLAPDAVPPGAAEVVRLGSALVKLTLSIESDRRGVLMLFWGRLLPLLLHRRGDNWAFSSWCSKAYSDWPRIALWAGRTWSSARALPPSLRRRLVSRPRRLLLLLLGGRRGAILASLAFKLILLGLRDLVFLVICWRGC